MADGWKLINHPMSDETGKLLAEQLKRQNDILAGMAAGNAGAEFVDATFRGLLDGQNTSEVFWSWWPLSAGDGVTKYQRLERFAKMLAEYAKGKTYTVRFYSDDVSGDYTRTVWRASRCRLAHTSSNWTRCGKQVSSMMTIGIMMCSPARAVKSRLVLFLRTIPRPAPST